MSYTEDDMLMLSGIQHFMFCPRQWALIHIEQLWDDNRLTIEGQILHRHVDDPFYRQKCGCNITLRAVSVASNELGLYGVTDAIELLPAGSDSTGCIAHPRYPGRWKPLPIEYKRGKPKNNHIDEVQLAAQAMCLEEMYGISIPMAQFYYGELRHRTSVEINASLRHIVQECASEMHRMFDTHEIPKATKQPKCRNCSLSNLCMPELSRCTTVTAYLRQNLLEDGQFTPA